MEGEEEVQVCNWSNVQGGGGGGQAQVGAGVVKSWSRRVQSMRGPIVIFKSFFSDRWKVDQYKQADAGLITPDVIVNEGWSGAEKSSVERKKSSVAGG